MIWNDFEIFAYLALVFWIIAIISTLKKQKKFISAISAILGTVNVIAFIVILWIYLERPPMRTLAETRLWYAFFLSFIGLVVYYRWNFIWFFVFSLSLSAIFILVNILNPETYNRSLMPALQSVWFIPHVVVYMIAYAFLAASFIVAIKGLFFKKTNHKELILLADNIVNIGFGFLTLGLLFGALWAKKAWGHYWTWDPKETWAFITWVAYLIYIHYRSLSSNKNKKSLYILFVSFLLLMVCWFGVQYLPSAANSVHTYAY